MNYSHAPGRNWNRPARKSRSVHLGEAKRQTAQFSPSPIWWSNVDVKQAPGRNWAHESPKPRRPRLAESSGVPAREHPPREQGGGDHDLPYEYHRPTADWSFPFSTREYARLLALRSRLSSLQPQR